jgi:hypothetical protein
MRYRHRQSQAAGDQAFLSARQRRIALRTPLFFE